MERRQQIPSSATDPEIVPAESEHLKTFGDILLSHHPDLFPLSKGISKPNSKKDLDLEINMMEQSFLEKK